MKIIVQFPNEEEIREYSREYADKIAASALESGLTIEEFVIGAYAQSLGDEFDIADLGVTIEIVA